MTKKCIILKNYRCFVIRKVQSFTIPKNEKYDRTTNYLFNVLANISLSFYYRDYLPKVFKKLYLKKLLLHNVKNNHRKYILKIMKALINNSNHPFMSKWGV